MNGPRKQYHSIPLRRHALQSTADRHTTGMQATLPAPSPRSLTHPASYVSQRQMPVMPDEDQQHMLPRLPKSAIRFTDEAGHQVIQQGSRRLVIHHQQEPPPPARRGVHWLLLVGCGMLLTLLLWMLGQWGMSSLQAHNLDATYGYPRTWQTDAVVGHHDSTAHPSHFLFENLHGHILVIELPGGEIAHALIYGGPTLTGPRADQFPVTASFADVRHDGHPEMVIQVDGQTIIYTNDGNKFVPQAP